jgi:methyltransferase (TIGR00027 family)
MLKELMRVVYSVADVEAAKAWYGRALGSEPVFDSPVACIFKVNQCSLSLVKAARPAPEGEPSLAAYWEVADVDDVVGRLVELGARVKTAPANVLTVRVAQVVDPFGNVLGLSGAIPSQEECSVDTRPSRSAHLVALCRALLALDDRDAVRRPDPFSELFLEPDARAVLADAEKRRACVEQKISRPLYGFFAARSAFMDEVFGRALEARTPQIVFLGAGYDTRALRFATNLGDTRVFEADIATTQVRKQELLRASGAALPPQLRFVAVDFRTDDFFRRVAAAGYDPSLRSLFIWEGVSYYLSQDAVERNLALVRRHCATDSVLAFDYMTTRLESPNSGEPFLSFMPPETIPGWVARFGFELSEHVDAAQMTERYLTLSDGEAAERPFSAIRLVEARAL